MDLEQVEARGDARAGPVVVLLVVVVVGVTLVDSHCLVGADEGRSHDDGAGSEETGGGERGEAAAAYKGGGRTNSDTRLM